MLLETSAQVTPRAAAKLKTLQHEPVLRLFVDGQTCCGVRYGLALEDEIRDGLAVRELHGVTLVVDPDNRDDCEGTIVDFVETPDGSGFTVTNPAAGGTCTCSR